MKVIAFASQKGGSGKTTLAGHVAVQAELSDFGPVAIVDADPQGSLTDWWNERTLPIPAFMRAEIDTLVEDLARARQLGVNLVVVDTPPAITTTIEQLIAVADLVVVPTRPSPHDLRAVSATIDMVDAQGKPLVFVINGAVARTRIAAESAVVLSQHGTVAPVTIHQRTDFAACMIDGRTVMEAGQSEASAEEIGRLWSYLHGRLNGSARRSVMSSRFELSSGATLVAAAAGNGE